MVPMKERPSMVNRGSNSRLAIGLMIVLCGITGLLLMGSGASSGAASPTMPPTLAPMFVDEGMIVQQLEERVVGPPLVFDDPRRELQINTGASVKTLPYPPEFGGGQSAFPVSSPNKTAFAFCNDTGLFVIAGDDFRQVDRAACIELHPGGSLPFEWSPDSRFLAYRIEPDAQSTWSQPSWDRIRFYDFDRAAIVTVDQLAALTLSWLPEWSPDWEYYVEAIRYPTANIIQQCVSAGPTAILVGVRETGEVTVLDCVVWERVRVERWLDDGQFLLAGYVPHNTSQNSEELYLGSASPQSLARIGIGVLDAHVVLDAPPMLAQIQVQDWETWDHLSDPVHCTLSLFDFRSMTSTEVEDTFCRQPADFHVLPAMQGLLYLNRSSDGDQSVLSLIRMDSQTVEHLYSGETELIDSVSTNGRYVALITDTNGTFERTTYYSLRMEHPRLIVFDLQLRRVVYEHRLDPQVTLADHIVLWSPTEAALMFDASGEDDVYLVALDDGLASEISLAGTIARLSKWSPGGERLLIVTGETEAQVVEVDSQRTIPITRPFTREGSSIRFDWLGENDWLLVEILPEAPDHPAMTVGRWIIDPAL